MGRLNLTKNNKRKKAASGIPNWLLSTIIVVVIVAVLLTCAISLITSTGLGLRLSTAMKSDDYRVSGNMMRYYYINTYSNFADTYETYMQYFSLGQSKSISDHDDILFGGTADAPNSYDTSMLGDFDGTWYDYFMAQTRDGVKSMLIYCEKADELGLSLTDEDKTTIEAAIDSAILEFKYSQLVNNGVESLSDRTCLNAMYGEGMSRTDIRKAMELSVLASKASEQTYDSIEAGVTEDRILAAYEAEKLDYDLVDYFYYTFSVSYKDVATEELGEGYDEAKLTENKATVDAKYKEKIDAAKTASQELEACATIEEFKEYVYNYIANKNYDSVLKKESINTNLLPSTDDAATIKAKLVENVVKEVVSGAASATDDVVTEGEGEQLTYKIYDIAITKEFATSAKNLKNTLFSNLTSLKNTYSKEKTNYVENDDISTWLFDAARVAGEKKNVMEGDGSTDAEFEIKEESFSADVYFVIKPRYRDESLAKNISWMMFEDIEGAEAAIEKIAALESLTKENFETAATELATTASSLDDYIEGSMMSDAFDTWLFDEETVIGSYTKTPIMMQDSSYMVAYYHGDGELSWKVAVKNSLVNDDVTVFEDEMATAYGDTVKANEWVFTWIGKAN